MPTVPALKQQQDTIATLVELAELGVPPSRLELVFNMLEDDLDVKQSFNHLLTFIAQQPIAGADPACRLGKNEIYERVKASGADLLTLARDETDYKSMIVKAQSTADKLALAQRLATSRLAAGVVPELDACFTALGLTPHPA